eukprot:TRINITY_DN6052_c0_g1_i3.p1 TRINITY_DN6052_c0_g1~~TRINITY_DN6052_c0_g1_i3.p1  ORF type:complete len:203 (+),score=43.57 TRINITY_DN6052_c0_g1_i3:152-760(+)
MAAKPVLHYFNIGGRATPIRIALFKAFGKDGWEDVQPDNWAEFKPTTPLGSVPMLTLPDGSKHAQTDALLRWAGKKSGLYPEDADAALVVDEIIATSNEVTGKAPQSADAAEKKRLREEYAASGFFVTGMKFAESKIVGPFLCGESLNIGDLALMIPLKMIEDGLFDYVTMDALEPFPKIKKLYESLKTDPLVVSYMAEYGR